MAAIGKKNDWLRMFFQDRQLVIGRYLKKPLRIAIINDCIFAAAVAGRSGRLLLSLWSVGDLSVVGAFAENAGGTGLI